MKAIILHFPINGFHIRFQQESTGQHHTEKLDLSKYDDPTSWVNAELEARKQGFDVEWETVEEFNHRRDK